MISFVGAFFLVRYRVHEAAEEKHKVDEKLGNVQDSPVQPTNTNPPIFATNPHLEGVGPFRRDKPPVRLLKHCHTLCIVLATAGFILALVGVVTYVWARLPPSSRVTATVAMGICVTGAFGVIVLPPPAEQSSPRDGAQA